MELSMYRSRDQGMAYKGNQKRKNGEGIVEKKISLPQNQVHQLGLIYRQGCQMEARPTQITLHLVHRRKDHCHPRLLIKNPLCQLEHSEEKKVESRLHHLIETSAIQG